MESTGHALRRLADLAPIAAALTGALWLTDAAAHDGHEHSVASSGWAGRVDEVLLAGAVLLVSGAVYWLGNIRRERRSDPSAGPLHDRDTPIGSSMDRVESRRPR